MKLHYALAVSLALAPTISNAELPRYKPWGMFGGYKDKIVGPNRWRVDTGVTGRADPGSAQHIAVYRAAELVRGAGFSYMQIVDQSGSETLIGIGNSTPTIRGAAGMRLVVVGSNSSEAPKACAAKRPEYCFTTSVVAAMDAARPFLRFEH